MFQAVASAAAATKYAYVSGSMSSLEAMVCAPTVEKKTEYGGNHAGCDQRTQTREVAMNSICRGIYVVWETPANIIAPKF